MKKQPPRFFGDNQGIVVTKEEALACEHHELESKYAIDGPI